MDNLCPSKILPATTTSYNTPPVFFTSILDVFGPCTDQPPDTWYCPNPNGGCEGNLNMDWVELCPSCGAEKPS